MHKINTIHIVSFDIPFPADYGGAIDVFFKIEALKVQGVEVILHCFEYGRARSEALDSICKQVYYYKRNMSFVKLLQSIPFIVNSRDSKELLKNLTKDDNPILFEGLHTCYFLNHPSLAARKRIVRTHNIEHDYYANLSKAEHKFFQKIYLRLESRKLRKYESELKGASGIAAISMNDQEHFSDVNTNTMIVSAFHQNSEVLCKFGNGDFVLYHGNLGVAENYQAAIYLITEVFSKSTHPLVIAGNNAPDVLRRLCAKYDHVKLVENLNTASILDLVSKAHINLLVTQQATGIKLKLLAALYTGRFCLVNHEMISNTGLESYCLIGNSSSELLQKIDDLMSMTFTTEMIQKRKELENSMFSNSLNVIRLTSLLFS